MTSVDAQLRICVPHFTPAVHATPESRARSSMPRWWSGCDGAVAAASGVSDIEGARSNITAATQCAALAQFLPPRRSVSDSPTDRFSVLHVLAPAAVGGLESVVRSLAAGQRRRGHDVVVAPLVTDVESRAG